MFYQEPKVPVFARVNAYRKAFRENLGWGGAVAFYIKSNGDVVHVDTKKNLYVIKPPKPVIDLQLNYWAYSSDNGKQALYNDIVLFQDGTIGCMRYDAESKRYKIVVPGEEEHSPFTDIVDVQRLAEDMLSAPHFFCYINLNNEFVCFNFGSTQKQVLATDVAHIYIMEYGDFYGEGGCNGYYITKKTGELVSFRYLWHRDGTTQMLTSTRGKPYESTVSDTLRFFPNPSVGISHIDWLSPMSNPTALVHYRNGDFKLYLLTGYIHRSGSFAYTHGQEPEAMGWYNIQSDENLLAEGKGIHSYAVAKGVYALCTQDGNVTFRKPNGTPTDEEKSAFDVSLLKGCRAAAHMTGRDSNDLDGSSYGATCLLTDRGDVVSPLVEERDIWWKCVHLYADYLGMAKTLQTYQLAQGAEVVGMQVSGTEPEGTERRILFKVDGVWNRLEITDGVASLSPCTKAADANGSGDTGASQKVALGDDDVTATYVLEHGNTVAQLTSVTSAPALNGKAIYVAVAMHATEVAEAMPTFALGFKTRQMKDVYEFSCTTQEYPLKGYTIASIDYQPIVKENGSVDVSASVRTNDTWSKELTLDELKGMSGDCVRFHITYRAPTVGVSFAEIGRLALALRRNTILLRALGRGDLVTKTQSFDTGMMYSRLYVKHAALRDARISADVMFRETPKRREMYKIAEGTGEAQTVKLSDTGIDFSSLRLFANDETIASFDFNSMENTVSFSAPSLCTVFASYAYEVEPEVWQPMQAQETQPYTNARGYASTSFAHEVTGTAKGYSAVRIRLEKPEGKVEDALLGVGTGRLQTFFLPHDAKTDTIQLKNGPDRVEARNWSYDAEHRMLQVIALKDREVTASYEFTAENPKVYGMVAAWNQ